MDMDASSRWTLLLDGHLLDGNLLDGRPPSNRSNRHRYIAARETFRVALPGFVRSPGLPVEVLDGYFY